MSINFKAKFYAITDDLKERFLTLETVGALYIVICVAILFFDETFLKEMLLVAFGGYGIYKVFVNRAKQKRLEKQKRSK